ncbi:hypothetical protein ANN_24000 [Periplaneta americana]|uniref:Uncharacterized protein n=1 Tax=Periplaneta americana TaxID=6978 RepID=A0ABQ8S268_PERAM|nr:hypothetical protein ANN_24000 [Periplaneta americana]
MKGLRYPQVPPTVCALLLVALVGSISAEDFDVITVMHKLARTDIVLKMKLDNVTLVVKDFIYCKNISSAEESVKLINEYIGLRKDFIKAYQDTCEEIVKRGIIFHSPYLASHLFSNLPIWEKDLNRTKDELFKLDQILKFYKGCELSRISKKSIKLNVKAVNKQILKGSRLQLLREDEVKACKERATQINDFSVSHNLTESVTSEWIEEMLDPKNWE